MFRVRDKIFKSWMVYSRDEHSPSQPRGSKTTSNIRHAYFAIPKNDNCVLRRVQVTCNRTLAAALVTRVHSGTGMTQLSRRTDILPNPCLEDLVVRHQRRCTPSPVDQTNVVVEHRRVGRLEVEHDVESLPPQSISIAARLANVSAGDRGHVADQ